MNQNIIFGLCSLFVVGLGQILKGQSEKGLKFILTFYAAIPILLYATLSFSGSLFLLVFGISVIFMVIFWIYNIVDAYK